MPCLTKHHSLFVCKAADPPGEARLVTAMEAAQAMGFNVLDPSWTQSLLKPIFEKLRPRDLKELMGNDATISEGSLDCD